jgi:Uma2 family endonuclease
MATPALVRPIDYPESDGKPIGESDVHRLEILFLTGVLMEYFANNPQIYVSGNLMFYYEEGNPSAVVSPDVFVVKGIASRLRRSYKLWEEGAAPCFVIEVSSRSTRLEDLGNKKALYAMLGVEEYVLFDPLAEYLKPPLQGFRLEQGEYVRVELEPDGALRSQTLGLLLRHEGHTLQLYNLATGQRLLRLLEKAAALRAAEERSRAAQEQARAEEQARRAAQEQARVEEQARRAAQEQARVEEQARRAAQEQARVEEQARRVAQERAAALEAEVERLRAELARKQNNE